MDYNSWQLREQNKGLLEGLGLVLSLDSAMSAWRWLLLLLWEPEPGAIPTAVPGPLPCPLPGTEILERASGWLSVSTLTCRNALHTGLCRCLQPRGTPVSPWDWSSGCGPILILALPGMGS